MKSSSDFEDTFTNKFVFSLFSHLTYATSSGYLIDSLNLKNLLTNLRSRSNIKKNNQICIEIFDAVEFPMLET